MKNTFTFAIFASFLLVIAVALSGCKSSTADNSVIPSIFGFPVISNVTATSAQGSAAATYNGGGVLSAVGFCWSSTNQTPTIANSKASHSADTTTFVCAMTGLTANTTYYARAFVTNEAGTGYGDVITFKTPTATFAMTANVSTFSGIGASGLANGLGTIAQFNNPSGICADSLGNVYVADTYNNVIRKITSTGFTSTYAGDGNLGYVDGAATSAEFYAPMAVAADGLGNIYVADNNRIRKITAAGVVSTLAGRALPTAGYVDGTGSNAAFNGPSGLVADKQGNVFVADKGNNVIRKITAAGVVSTLAGSTTGLTDGTGTAALFNAPSGVAVDSQGNVYVADLNNYAIRKVTSAGVVTTIVGNNTLTTIIGNPSGVCLDNTGNLYISDASGRILELTTGNILYSLAGTSGSTGFVNGANAAALFNTPKSIAVNSSGNVFVDDFGNNVVRKITVVTQP